MKRALILGIGGQDGSYLADILCEQGYEVHGMVRHSSVDNLRRLRHIEGDPRNENEAHMKTIHYGDMTDPMSVYRILADNQWDEVYNEADQDSVGYSYNNLGYSMDVTASAVGRTLEAIRLIDSKIKFFQPVSATMFGNAPAPQDENTPLNPQSPYACAKAAAYYLCRFYRQTYGMFVSTAIMYNHDSPRRNEGYLLQKIVKAAVRIAHGDQDKLALGNLDTIVDIGFAGDYMQAAYDIMQLNRSEDFVLASGNHYTIEDLVSLVFTEANVKGDPRDYIKQDTEFYRPGPQPTLVGRIAKAKLLLPNFTGSDIQSWLIEKLVEHWKWELYKECV